MTKTLNPETRRLNLETLCRKWKTILRLDDWDVFIKHARHWEMGSAARAGECVWVTVKKTARISILDPLDYQPDFMLPEDIELTVVHELLHLHFAGIDDDFKGTRMELFEQAIHAISSTLVILARAAPTT